MRLGTLPPLFFEGNGSEAAPTLQCAPPEKAQHEMELTGAAAAGGEIAKSEKPDEDAP
jgi:hypothetical protein